jgi:hypothetical protein
MNIGNSVENDLYNKGHQLWIDLDYASQKIFLFRDWLSIKRTVESDELIPFIHSEIINNYEIR